MSPLSYSLPNLLMSRLLNTHYVQDGMLKFGDEVLNKGVHCTRLSVLVKRVITQLPITFTYGDPNITVFLCYNNSVAIQYYIVVDVIKKY